MQKTRKFDGKIYRLKGYAPTKKEAERRKKVLKQTYRYVRVIKMKGMTIIGATNSRYGKMNYFIYARR